MENNTENTEQNSEVMTEMSENASFVSIETSTELPLPQMPIDAPSELPTTIPQNPVYDGGFPSLCLNVSHAVLNEVGTTLNTNGTILNDFNANLNESVNDLNALKPVLNGQSSDLNGLGHDLNGDTPVLSEGNTVLNPTEIYTELLPEKPILKPELIPIFQYVKAQPIRADRVSLKPVGIDESLFHELMAITKQGGIPISRYCSEVLRHHEDVLSLQLMKNELAEYKHRYNEKVNELLHLTMDKKKVEDSAQLLLSTTESHRNSKNDTLQELQQTQLELDRANATIVTLRKGIENVSDAVQDSYNEYLTLILPESLTAALKDTYDELMSIVKNHKLPKSFEVFEMYFSERYKAHMELIKKEVEIRKLIKLKSNEA